MQGNVSEMKAGLKVIERDGVVREILSHSEALEVLRHSTSHLMALAVSELYPDVHLGIGPATEDGFYYDFQANQRFTEEDLARIAVRMEELKQADLPFQPAVISRDEALELFGGLGERLKLELIKERDGEVLSCYRLGRFVDFCIGPHVVSTGQLGAFRLLSVAGSYWRGDERREQLQRIYGTAFFGEAELEAYLHGLAEARKRDHRRLGKDLDLFTVREEVAPGLIFWHPKGARVRAIIEDFLRTELIRRGYQFVYTPHIAKSDLWKTSGHYDYYRPHMYTLPVDEEEYVLKPMNCPGHIVIYQSTRRSYRELPLRIAEFGTVYRYEKSGTLHGLLRVRGFTQDDAHIFCQPSQVLDEVINTLDVAEFILKSFGFEQFKVELSAWDPAHPEAYAGKPEDWEMAEAVLVQALGQKGWEYTRQEGEASFYGPKIDIKLIDALNRPWQLSTFQFDFNLPVRFNVTYAGADSKEHHVLMIHRALLGSMERFMGVLVEHYGGAFPLWLAPVQAVVVPVSDKFQEYAVSVERRLNAAGLRVEADLRNEKVGYKIREAQLSKTPYMLVVGDREAKSDMVAVRSRSQGDLGPMSLPAFVAAARELVESRAVKP
jgi:threonyl-tRNA synthetase